MKKILPWTAQRCDQAADLVKTIHSWADGSVTVDYGTLYSFHMSFTAQLPFLQNMYVLNIYANYPNGNQEAWPFQLADLFLLHFSCNTSQSLVMKHTVLWRLYVARSATGNWTLLLPQTDLTLQWDDVTNNTSTPQASNYSMGLFVNACFFCVSQTCSCWCNWNQHPENGTPYPPLLLLGESGHSRLILYIGHQSFCSVWLLACMIQYVFSWTHKRGAKTH